MYTYIKHVLANYLSTNVGHSDDGAILILRKDLENCPELAKGVMADLLKAFDDRDFSWREVMAEYDVISTDSEDGASQKSGQQTPLKGKLKLQRLFCPTKWLVPIASGA